MNPQIHNYYLNLIKKLLNASFVGWINEKNSKYLLITINNNNLKLPFKGGDEITEKAYKDLINTIINENGNDTIRESISLDEEK